MQQHLFGYGSLLNPASAMRTLLRDLTIEELRLVNLLGYRRTWTYVTDTRFAVDPPNCVTPTVFLNLTPAEGVVCNGLLLRVGDADIARLDRRERGYDRIDVTAQVDIDIDSGHQVFTYVAGPGFRTADRAGEALVVPKRYLGIIDQALVRWGADARARYDQSTEPPPYPLRDGDYAFDHPDQECAARRRGE